MMFASADIMGLDLLSMACMRNNVEVNFVDREACIKRLYMHSLQIWTAALHLHHPPSQSALSLIDIIGAA